LKVGIIKLSELPNISAQKEEIRICFSARDNQFRAAKNSRQKLREIELTGLGGRE